MATAASVTGKPWTEPKTDQVYSMKKDSIAISEYLLEQEMSKQKHV